MRRHFLSEALLATTLAACSETGLRPLNPEHELTPLDPLSETTTEPVDLPVPPFSELIKGCLAGLDLPPCPSPDADCSQATEEEKAFIISAVQGWAQSASGDSSMTVEDMEEGASVPASVYGHYVLSEGDEYGRSIWSNYAYSHIAFGDHEQDFRVAYEGEAELSPYETIPGVDTLTCHGQAYSYDGPDQMISEQFYIQVTAADGTVHKASIYDLVETSGQWEVNDTFYDATNTTLDFGPTQEALDLGVEGALEAALKTAGDAEEKNSKVNQY